MMRIDDAMERLLDDWGWWARERQASGYRCRSIEGRYLRTRVPGDDERTPRGVDEAACLAVERAVCHPEFPREARGLLVGWWVRRDSLSHITARLGIPRATFEDRLHWAANVLRNRMKINIDTTPRVTTIAAFVPTDRDTYPAAGGVVTPKEHHQARQA